MAALSWQELQILARRVVGELPASDSEMAATTNAAPGTVIKNGLVG